MSRSEPCTARNAIGFRCPCFEKGATHGTGTKHTDIRIKQSVTPAYLYKGKDYTTKHPCQIPYKELKDSCQRCCCLHDTLSCMMLRKLELLAMSIS